jgi:ligand-binding sensor domain-containing protein
VAITGDGRGGIFAGTLRDGAFHLDPTGHWQAMLGLPSPWALCISRSEHEVCVGTQDGAACYDSGPPKGESAWRAPTRIDGLPDPRVHAFLAEKGSLLVGTEDGLAIHNEP